MPVVAESPTFTLVVELANPLKSLVVVNESDLVLPRQLINLSVQYGHSFGEVFSWNIDLLHYLSRIQIDSPQRRPTFLPGALKQFSVEKD